MCCISIILSQALGVIPVDFPSGGPLSALQHLSRGSRRPWEDGLLRPRGVGVTADPGNDSGRPSPEGI